MCCADGSAMPFDKEKKNVERRKERSALLDRRTLLRDWSRGGVRRADRRVRCAGLSVPCGARRRSIFRSSRSARPLPTRAAHRRAAKAEIVVECRRGLSRAAAGGDRPRHSSRSTISTSNWSITAARPTSCWRRLRPARSDAGLGMALRWLKPLEQGFDVKIAAGTHGGCMRVLSRANSGVDKLADLKGKIVGGRRSRRAGQELLLDPALQAGHRSNQGGRLARLSRQSAAARRREGRSPGVPGFGPDRLYLAEGPRLQGSRFQSRR